jgi:serine/threonine-protein kinase
MASSDPPPSGSTSKLAFPGSLLVGKFRLEEIIGYGGMGSVWRATHLGLGQEIAIKLVSIEFVKSADALRRFDTEAKAAAKIRSRHVPQVFDNGVLEDGTPYLAMELLTGQTLFKRVHVGGPIPLAETVLILEQCCRALGRAHGLGIVHRDIKPDNIYLATSQDDDGYVVKVLDFGIAKVQTLAENEHLSTRTGQLLGTPMYMSPEQARGLRTIDHRTDLYSLGLVAHVMLTGNLAFSSESLGDLLVQICTQPLPSLRAQNPNLPPAMEDWFQKACARDAEQRYPSAQAFIDALRLASGVTASGPERLSALGPMSLDQSGGTLRAQTTPLPNAGVGGSTMPLQAGSPSVSTTGGTAFEGQPAGVPKKSGKAIMFAAAGIGLAAGVLGITLMARHHEEPPAKSAEGNPASTVGGGDATGASKSTPQPSATPSATIAALPDLATTGQGATPTTSASGKATTAQVTTTTTQAGGTPHHTTAAAGNANAAAGGGQKHTTTTTTTTTTQPKGIDLGY